MVIECPSCKTKFAVDGAQLRDVDAPRFHCSRCDHFFEKSRYELGLIDSPQHPPARTASAAPEQPAQEYRPVEAAQISASPSAMSAAVMDDDLDMPFEADFDDEQLPEGLRMAIEDEVEAAKQLDLIGEEETLPEIHPPFSSSAEVTTERAASGERTIQSPRRVETVSLLEDDDLPPIRAEWPGASTVEPQEVDLSDLSKSWSPDRGIMGRGIHAASKAVAATKHTSGAPVTGASSLSSSPLGSSSLGSSSVGTARLSADAIDSLLGSAATSSASSGPDIGSADRLDAVLRPTVAAAHAHEDETAGDFTFERELLGGREFVPATPTQSPDWSLDGGSESKTGSTEFESSRGISSAAEVRMSQSFGSPNALLPADDAKSSLKSAAVVNFPKPSFNLAMPHISGLSASKLAARSAVGFICSVPLALALTFWVWSKNIESTPTLLSETLHLTPSGLPHLAPPTMELVDLNSRSITLDDGKRVLEITGNLLNATMKSYSGITLEARVFDEQNSVIDRMVVNLKNGLSTATVASLSPEALSDLQQREVAADPGVEPNARVPFRVIFTEPLDRAAWFSTKIYSVTPSVG